MGDHFSVRALKAYSGHVFAVLSLTLLAYGTLVYDPHWQQIKAKPWAEGYYSPSLLKDLFRDQLLLAPLSIATFLILLPMVYEVYWLYKQKDAKVAKTFLGLSLTIVSVISLKTLIIAAISSSRLYNAYMTGTTQWGFDLVRWYRPYAQVSLSLLLLSSALCLPKSPITIDNKALISLLFAVIATLASFSNSRVLYDFTFFFLVALSAIYLQLYLSQSTKAESNEKA